MEFRNHNIHRTILHGACRSGNIDLVRYIISLNKFDIADSDILFNLIIFTMFQNDFHL